MADVNRAFKHGGLEGVVDLIVRQAERGDSEESPRRRVKIGAKIVPALIEGFVKRRSGRQLLGGALHSFSRLGADRGFSARRSGRRVGSRSRHRLPAGDADRSAAGAQDGSRRRDDSARTFGKVTASSSTRSSWRLSSTDLDVAVRTARSSDRHGDRSKRSPTLAEMITGAMTDRARSRDRSRSDASTGAVPRGHQGRRADRLPRQAIGDAPRAFDADAEGQRRKARQGFGTCAADISIGRARGADRTTKGIARATEQNMGKAEQSAKTHGKGAGQGISQPYQAAARSPLEARCGNIEKNTNQRSRSSSRSRSTSASRRWHEDRATVPARSPARRPDLRRRPGTGDIVPAMLEPGEVVLNRKAVKALGGAGRANRINKRFPRFQGAAMVEPAGPRLGRRNPADRRRRSASGQSNSTRDQLRATTRRRAVSRRATTSPGRATDTRHPAAGWTSLGDGAVRARPALAVGTVDQILYGTAGIGTSLAGPRSRQPRAHRLEDAPAVQRRGRRDDQARSSSPGRTTSRRTSPRVRPNRRALGGEQVPLEDGAASAAATSASFPQQGMFSVADMEALRLQVNRGTANAHTMAAIGMAESSGDPHAFGPTGRSRPVADRVRACTPRSTSTARPMTRSPTRGWPATSSEPPAATRRGSSTTPAPIPQFLQGGGIVQRLQNGGVAFDARGAPGSRSRATAARARRTPLADWFEVHVRHRAARRPDEDDHRRRSDSTRRASRAWRKSHRTRWTSTTSATIAMALDYREPDTAR